MSEAVGSPGACIRRSLSIFTASRLQLYGYALALIYTAALIHYYLARAWIVDHSGAPLYGDFTDAWVAGWHALNAQAAQLYDSNEFVRIQKALLGARDYFYPHWPYPPTFFLILAPLSMLPYVNAFLTWDVATLLYSLLATRLKVLVRLLPRDVIAAMAAIATSAAISPYSIAVTPASSWISFLNNACIGFSWRFKPAQAAEKNLKSP